MKKLVLALDCGATNVRTAAVDENGTVVHIEALPNAPILQEKGKNWLIWDTDTIWEKLLLCAGKTIAAIGGSNFAAIVVAAFSDDGAPVTKDGELLYPVISWQCTRTAEIAERIDDLIPISTLYRITGEQVSSQHTLFRILWLQQNKPEVLEKAHMYLMFPHIINYRLTGQMVNDPTTADSMMLLDIRKRYYSDRILSVIGFPSFFFGKILEPGEIIGTLRRSVAELIGLNETVPVIAAGHDTQFAIAGTGCKANEAVLSSGTWEILFRRSRKCITNRRNQNADIKYECDAVPGVYNLGQQWVGSGIIEWLVKMLFRNNTGTEVHQDIIELAEGVFPGSNGILIDPFFLTGAGVNYQNNRGGTIGGYTMQTSPEELYRALLEGLSFNLRKAVENINRTGDSEIRQLTLVGGGSKNRLWNSIRADVLNIPIRLTQHGEHTVVGAALFGFIGLGHFRDYNDALDCLSYAETWVKPGKHTELYDEKYQKYLIFKKNCSG